MDRGEVPGYEFEVPRGPRHASGPRYPVGHDSFRHLQRPRPEPGPRSSVRTASSGVFAVMRTRNWLMGLAVPLLAAIAVGIAVVVIAGGGGGAGGAPSALAAGFPPARLAGASFTGKAETSRVILTSIGASAGTEVAAGGVNSGPALWTSADGGATWARAALAGPTSLTRSGAGQLAGVAHGPAGWLAVGNTIADDHGPVVASSRDAHNWTVTSGLAVRAVASSVAAGPAGYVIVGRRPVSKSGAAVAAAWYSPGLTGWRPAAVTLRAEPGPRGVSGGQTMDAVTATGHGFVAVGATDTRPAAWLSATGQTWQQVQVPVPANAERAALDYVAANGSAVVAAGTEFSAAGASSPFAEVSVNGGATWAPVQLPVPEIGPGTGTTVTALTAAGHGFTAVGTYVTKAGPEVVVWTLPPGAVAAGGAAWSTATPQGTGLAGASAQNAITALAADGATLTGVGFTAALSASGAPGTQKPTLWQSPIRY